MTDSSRARAVVDEHALGDPQLVGSQTDSCRQFLCPAPGSFVAVSGQFLKCAVTRWMGSLTHLQMRV